MAQEKVVFDADVSKFLKGLADVEAKQKQLRKDIVATAKASTLGSIEATKAYVEQSKALANLSNQKKVLNQNLSVVIGGTQQLGRSMGQTNMIIQQGVFAVDDFLTVVGQQGLAGGLRAAGNNLSLILSMFNPWLALVPAAATAIATFALKTDDSADATDKAKDSLDRYKDALISIQDEIKKAQMTSEEWQRHQASLPAQREVGRLNEEKMKAEGELKARYDEMIAFLSQFKEGFTVDKNGQFRTKSGGIFPGTEAKQGEINEARRKVMGIQDRIEQVNDMERRRVSEVDRRQRQDEADRRVSDAVGQSISDAEKELDDEQQRPRFGLIKRDISRKEKEVAEARKQYDDASVAAARPGSPGGRRVTEDERKQLDNFKDMKELLERQLEVLKEMQQEAKQDIQKGLILGRTGQEYA